MKVGDKVYEFTYSDDGWGSDVYGEVVGVDTKSQKILITVETVDGDTKHFYPDDLSYKRGHKDIFLVVEPQDIPAGLDDILSNQPDDVCEQIMVVYTQFDIGLSGEREAYFTLIDMNGADSFKSVITTVEVSEIGCYNDNTPNEYDPDLEESITEYYVGNILLDNRDGRLYGLVEQHS